MKWWTIAAVLSVLLASVEVIAAGGNEKRLTFDRVQIIREFLNAVYPELRSETGLLPQSHRDTEICFYAVAVMWFITILRRELLLLFHGERDVVPAHRVVAE